MTRLHPTRIRIGDAACEGITIERIRELERELMVYARSAVRSEAVAQDLVQETATAALAQPSAYDNRGSLAAWLKGILSHKIADHFRRSGRELVGAEDTVEGTDEMPERQVESRLDLEKVDAALGELPSSMRLAILMVDVEGLDREEACAVLGVSRGHLRILLHRARGLLKDAVVPA